MSYNYNPVIVRSSITTQLSDCPHRSRYNRHAGPSQFHVATSAGYGYLKPPMLRHVEMILACPDLMTAVAAAGAAITRLLRAEPSITLIMRPLLDH